MIKTKRSLIIVGFPTNVQILSESSTDGRLKSKSTAMRNWIELKDQGLVSVLWLIMDIYFGG